MSVIATAVRHLMAAGVTGEELCAAIAEMEADIRAEPKPRSAGAIRQQRYRERNKASQVTESDGCDASPSLSPSPKENKSNPHPHTHPENTTRTRKAEDFPCPDWADPNVWRDLKRNRKAKRLANTPTAHKRFVEAVEAMADDEWPPGRLLEGIVAKGWGGAHDPRENGKSNNGNDFRKSSGTGPDKRSGLARAIDAELERVSAFPQVPADVAGDAAEEGW
ncbi:hypothetical protein [Pelagerythrobacter marinus]|uniref:hypothetical protein n=1 Tax=Pelagerythrobacter marinus TaxID=538382 RepID=UPI002AC9B2CA|nr:hypothetical protein [Pelagerythrobacter marinus]WPZ05504.1 hypothetical protein T8T98_08665 [Pelagerythrobacter marinus]